MGRVNKDRGWTIYAIVSKSTGIYKYVGCTGHAKEREYSHTESTDCRFPAKEYYFKPLVSGIRSHTEALSIEGKTIKKHRKTVVNKHKTGRGNKIISVSEMTRHKLDSSIDSMVEELHLEG